MNINQKYLKTAAILTIVFSLIIFVVSFVYVLLSILSLIWISFLSLIVVIEVCVCFFGFLFFFNPKKRIFFIGLLSLFAALIPGIMILTFYFKAKKNLLDSFEFNN